MSLRGGNRRRRARGGAPGGTGPNQVKSFTRAGMGPCQGRMCALTVSEVIADQLGKSMAEIGTYRVRFPIKPLTVGELVPGMTGGR